ncbi:MAG: rhodanese-related sulfurtransferase [Hyphomicrobiales bacterium]|nr:rhodanese-related sulfurtransferase [Hyphomicrobiales bacterium]
MTSQTDQIIPEPPAGRPEVVAAFYKFVALDDIENIKPKLEELCANAGIVGTILLAREGVNGTVSGSYEGIRALMAWFAAHNRIAGVPAKFSFAERPAFYRMKVRLKKEIVTMGEPDVDPNGAVGAYVRPQDWNALISDPETLVIDTRNDYEVAIGTFDRAVNPHTKSFREFPAWVKENLDNLPEHVRPKKIAMFCTGGIRCEKSTSYLVSRGYDSVYHLDGGILKYLETIPPEESAWKGECFVFDQRVSVRHGLEPGDYDMCHACRMPLTEEEKHSPHYEAGVSCPKCFGTHDEDQLGRFRERQKQIRLARERGEEHIGVGPHDTAPRDTVPQNNAPHDR